MPTETELYGTHTAGNIPWKSKQHHEIGQKAQKIFAQPFKKVPSKVAKPNEYNTLVDRHLLNLIGVNPEVAKSEKKKIRLRSEIREYVDHLSPEQKAEFFKNSKTGITESELYNPELDIFNPPVSEANNESYDLAKKEIKGSMDKGYLKPMLSKIEGTTNPLFSSENAATLKQFENHYGEMGNSVLQEMSENYLRNIAPNVNYNFMKAGLWNSPLRNSHQNLVLSELGKNAMHNLTKLKAQGFEKGVEHISQSKQHNLAANQLAANVIRGEKEDANVAAKNLIKTDESQLTADMAKAEALRQAAADKQRNENATLEEIQRHAIAEQEHDRRMIEREATLASGLPSNIDMPGYKMAETSPNYAAMAASSLGTLSGLGNLFAAAKKSGGLVGKYAPGGIVLPNLPITPEMQQHEAEVREIHNNNHIGDPRWHAVAKMGASFGQNYKTMGPAAAMGKAGNDAIDAFTERSKDHQLQRERGINLMQQIQTSRMKQQEVMADYDRHMKTLNETTRHHRASEGLLGESLKVKSSPKTVKETVTDRKMINEARKDLMRSLDMKKQLSHIESLAEKTSTGPIVGSIKSLLPETKSDQGIRTATDKLIIDMHQGMKNIPRSEKFMERIEATKPNIKNYYETNKKILNTMNEGSNDIEENSINTLLAHGWTPARIEKEFKIKLPQHFYEDENGYVEADQPLPTPEHETMAVPSSSNIPTKEAIYAELKRRGLVNG